MTRCEVGEEKGVKRRYALLGNPVKHSLSPLIHRAFAQDTQKEVSYEAICVALEEFAKEMKKLASEGFSGANVTLPFKEEAFLLADDCTPEAQAAQSANTLAFREKIIAHNTDGLGLLRDLKDNLGQDILGARLLLLGAGGAARAVVPALLGEKPKCLFVSSRTFMRAQVLAAAFPGVQALPLEEAGAEHFDLVLNATSAGHAGLSPDVPREALFGAFCYDLNYKDAAKPFLALAQSAGAKERADGLGMLVAQAAESFLFWEGVLPSYQEVLKALRHA